MKYINLIMQTLFIVALLIFVILFLTGIRVLVFLLMAQAMLGLWQYLGAIVLSLSSRANPPLLNYLRISSGYFFLLIIIAPVSADNFSSDTVLFQFLIFFLPSCLAIYCYIITWKHTFSQNRKNGSFLPHLSF
jgi:hypothetical protein